MTHHLLPNAIAPAVVFVMTDAVLTIVLGSSLGFLGLGVQPPTAEWGVMIAEGQLYLGTAWWISVFPGIAISVLALGFSLVADGLARLLHTAAMNDDILLTVEDLEVEFATAHGPVPALRGVSFAHEPRRGAGHRRGERLGQDGRLPRGDAPSRENARILARPDPLRGAGHAGLDQAGLAKLRGERIAMIFQNPSTHLDPLMTGRPPGRRGAAGASGPGRRDRRAGGPSSSWPICGSPIPSAGSMPMPIS